VDLPLPRMPVLDDYPTTPQSLPDSPAHNSRDTNMSGNMSRMKINSAGTQYDVTSFIGKLTTPGLIKGPAFDRLTDIDSEDNGGDNSTRTTVIMQVPNPPDFTSTARPINIDAGPAIFPSAITPSSEPVVAFSGPLTLLRQACVDKSMPALPPQAMMAAPEPQMNALNRPAHKRKISSNILPSFSMNSPLYSTRNVTPYHSAGENVTGATENANVNERRHGMGLPEKPRLTICGLETPLQNGKTVQAPGAFERPRPPPLVLQ